MCQNGGTFDNRTCTCACTDGFSGADCESECIVIRLAPANVSIILVIVSPSVKRRLTSVTLEGIVE